MPYYETALEPMDCVFIAFQEIVARPLINEYMVSVGEASLVYILMCHFVAEVRY